MHSRAISRWIRQIAWKGCLAFAILAYACLAMEGEARAQFGHRETWATNQGGDVGGTWLAGDFDGSGTADLAYVFWCSDGNGGQVCIDVHLSCTWWVAGPSGCQQTIGSNNGAFVNQRWVSFSGAWPSTFQAVAGDFNRDGLSDIAFVYKNGSNIGIQVYYSNGSTFLGPYNQTGGTQSFNTPYAVLAGWFDGISPDIAFVWEDSGRTDISVFLGPTAYCAIGSCTQFTWSPGWATRNDPWGSSATWLAPGDLDFLNNDRADDLAQAYSANGQRSIDVELGARTASTWASGQGPYTTPSAWTSARAMGPGPAVLYAFEDTGGTISIDAHVSNSSQFQRWPYITQQGQWNAQMQQFVGANFVGNAYHGAQCDVASIYDTGGNISLDVYVNDLYPERSGCGLIPAGTAVSLGGVVSSCDGRFKLTMQNDGNLVLYNGPVAPGTGGVQWMSNTPGTLAATATMQTDDNFCAYAYDYASVPWCSGTGGHDYDPGAKVQIGNNGVMSIVNGSGSTLSQSLTTQIIDVAIAGNQKPEPSIGVSESLVAVATQNIVNFYNKSDLSSAGSWSPPSSVSGCTLQGGDTKLVFDATSASLDPYGRGLWVVSSLCTTTGSPNPVNAVAFFVSQDSSANPAWTQTAVWSTPNVSLDDPCITVSKDKVTVGFGSPRGAMWVIDKSQLVQGNVTKTCYYTLPGVGAQIREVRYGFGGNYTNPGAAVPSTAYMIAPGLDAQHVVWLSIDGTCQSGLTVNQHTLPITQLNSLPAITQQGGTTLGGAGNSAIWQSNRLWWSSNDGCGAFTCPRMIQIATDSGTVVTDADFSMPNTFLWAAVPAVDATGNMWALMSWVTPSTAPGEAVAGVLTNGQWRAPAPLVNGLSPFTGYCSNGNNPCTSYAWGDFFESAQDPSDGTIWLAGEYGGAGGNAASKVIHVQNWWQ